MPRGPHVPSTAWPTSQKIEDLGTEPGLGSTAPSPLTVYQRLAEVSREVAVKATGKTAQGTPTLSIADVEDALRPLLAKYGLVTGYRWNAPPLIVGTEGKLTLWQADLTVWISTVDGAADRIEDRVFDIGSSPSAAVSFALKRYYRALFHLADAEDETRSAPVQSHRRFGEGVKPIPFRGPTDRPVNVDVDAATGEITDQAVEGEPTPTAPQETPAITSPKGQALNRVMNLAAAKGLSATALWTLAKTMFGRTGDALTTEQLTELGNEVDVRIVGKP